MTTQAENKKKAWNDPQKIDTIGGWIVLAVIGGVVFLVMGRNLMPYAQLFGDLAAGPVRDLRWGGLFAPFVGVVGSLVGIGLFMGIQYLELRPQLIMGSLPEGQERNRKLRSAWIWFAIALTLDIFFCMLFWPPVNSPLGWGVFRGGFAMSLIAKMNIVQTFLTLFGGMLFVWAQQSIKKHW